MLPRVTGNHNSPIEPQDVEVKTSTKTYSKNSEPNEQRTYRNRNSPWSKNWRWSVHRPRMGIVIGETAEVGIIVFYTKVSLLEEQEKRRASVIQQLQIMSLWGQERRC